MISNSSLNHSENNPLQWQTAMPLLRSTILRSFFLVLLVPAACLGIFLLSLEWIDGQLTTASAATLILITLGILAGLFILGIIAILVLYGNRYQVQFKVTDSGVHCEVIGKTRRKNAWVNGLLVLSGKPGPAGAGLIAASRQSEFVPWAKVDNVRTYPEKQEIHLRKGRQVLMLLHCPGETYPKILQAVETHLIPLKTEEN